MKQSMWWEKKKMEDGAYAQKKKKTNQKKQKWNAQSDETYPQEKKTVKLMANKI
jgi:hypothetical protein